MTDQHDPDQLAAYAIGLLDDKDAQATEAHVAGCLRCRQELTELREVDGALRGMPPELFLDGPPPGGELVLQRTLRQVRTERERSGVRRRQRRLALIAAALAVLVGVGAAGVALGRVTTSETITARPTLPVTGTRLLTGFDPFTGARMTVTVTPAAGWVRIKATLVGIPSGERCTLVVIDRNRDRYIAASWLASPAAETNGITIDGAAVVAPADLAAVAVQNFEHRELVIAPA